MVTSPYPLPAPSTLPSLHPSLRRWAAALALLAGCGTAAASVLIGTEYPASTPLYTVSQSTGALTAGPATGLAGIGDLASAGTTGELFAIQIDSNTLYRLDAASGAVLGSVGLTTLGVTGGPEKIVTIAYDPNANVIYGNSTLTLGGGSDLFRIDPGTGIGTYLGTLQVDPMYAMAFDALTNTLYGAQGEQANPSDLWTIDTTNAALGLVGRLKTGGNFDIAIRPEDGQMFLASTDEHSLFMVDKSNASETLVGAYGSSTNIAGLAFVGSVPEPMSAALLLSALALPGLRRRR